MSEEAMLEQYPATLTEFAAPVASDDEIVAMFRPLLAQTRLQKLPLRCAPHSEVNTAVWVCKPDYRLADVRTALQGWPTQLRNMAGAAQHFMSKLIRLAPPSF